MSTSKRSGAIEREDIDRSRRPGHYEHRLTTGGIGHDLPQQAPQAFAQAVIDVGRF